ncbi:hypothetical protein HYH03_000805 [Edaphochlamys debaryana]|uniref:Uncharacterized protein n=1 Tax=Edaphochlamys debaryana TaxID=47281 RepID=A0A836C6C2_9CHLO|nr:hypothetical protein HYH03_000805 [Edaphochlamys debaryana]|eukprot:KAG2500983.1 hypothetical protein HYH03_000805 [Edaphochlamys debaryana]
MDEADIIGLIRAERQATGRKLKPELRFSPKTEFAPPQPKRETMERPPPPFVPVNPNQAKDMAARAGTERFINVNTPYEAHREDFNEGRTVDEGRRVAPFVPCCATQAKDTIRVKYTLTSPLEEGPALASNGLMTKTGGTKRGGTR